MPPINKQKNIIGISKDSIYKMDKYYQIDNLEKILETDLINFGYNPKFADNPKWLRIQFLHPEKESISDLENNLLRVFNIYNNVNSQHKDSLELNIEFKKFVSLKPPPDLE